MFLRTCQISIVLLALSACGDKQPQEGSVAAELDPDLNTEVVAQSGPGHTPTVPSIGCKVTTGPNKGKTGTRTEDGWCEGDWGGTECRPRSKCEDANSGGGVAVADGAVADRPALETPAPLVTGNSVVGIVPGAGANAVEYCALEDRILTVTFENTGNIASAAGTDVSVTFDTRGGPVTRTATRPSIPINGIVEMALELPDGCFTPDCEFSIAWSNRPPVLGRCLG
ncbi:hypothetical protein ACRAQ7_12995 [Erythrobacter sp. W53]|uniref:hypothetical protein n=1 Tax=Erythrobacter sp. W53 TaxID=3425947 RepID=UPI003D766E19